MATRYLAERGVVFAEVVKAKQRRTMAARAASGFAMSRAEA